MFWWIFGGALALFSAPVAIVIAATIHNPSPRRTAAPVPCADLPQPVAVTVSAPASQPRRRIKPYSNLDRIAQQNKARRESIDRRYNRVQPW